METQAQILDTSLLAWDKEAASGDFDVPADLTWGTIRLGGEALMRKAEVLIELTEKFPVVQKELGRHPEYQQGVDLARELTGL
ncbi:hypothetical protein [Actinoplanes sp. NPDC051494]|uniref:hypothetical protein n=1 Tax=Actinoplanes sp. NPDC051494 TaxID=3363907 RepID=UPI0037A1BE79